jgi:hypothetical protein
LLSIVLAPSAFGQQGGYGGGGFGGGAAQGKGEISSKQLFLTPSDRTEWGFEAKDDEAVMITVSSEVFDPAVKVEDEKGKVLAENDDLAPGNQTAQLLVALPRAGKYKAVVYNYKGTAGGAFSITLTRMSIHSVKVGESAAVGGDSRLWARLRVEKPGLYVLAARFRGVDLGVDSRLPTGESMTVVNGIDAFPGYRRIWFKADAPGDYFFRPSDNAPAVLRALPAKIIEAKAGDRLAANLDRDEVVLARVSAKRFDLLEFAMDGSSHVTLDFRPVTPETDEPRLRSTVLSNFTNPRRSKIEMLDDGSLPVAIYADRGEPSSYKLEVRPTGKGWTADHRSAQLGWNESEVFSIDLKAGDSVAFRASSPSYIVHMTLFDPNGGLRSSTEEGTPVVSMVADQASVGGRYVLLVTGGGIGPYTLVRTVSEPRPLLAGTTSGEIKTGSQVWKIHAKKGQDLAIRIASDEIYWRATLVNPNGKLVQTLTRGGSENDDLLRLTALTDGDYTLTVEAQGADSGKYEIKVVDLNK